MLQQAGTATAPADALIKETTTQTFVRDVIEESERAAGAGRLLGAVVRPLPAADTHPREGGASGQGQGSS